MTYSNIPVCVLQKGNTTSTATDIVINPSTTQFIVQFIPELTNTERVFVQCRGY
jgi:hypothetical protein